MDRGTIQDLTQKSKSGLDTVLGEWGLIIAIILVGVGSFGLGRLSALNADHQGISVSQAAGADAPALPLGGSVIGSTSGSLYYYPWCTGGSSIPPEKQVWFKDEKAAQKAGYSPAKNCKGLAE